jgi:hypothetical protein
VEQRKTLIVGRPLEILDPSIVASKPIGPARRPRAAEHRYLESMESGDAATGPVTISKDCDRETPASVWV